MLLMFGGLAVFLGLHSFQIAAPVRSAVIGRVGRIAYQILYSLGSLAGLVMISDGYVAWKYQQGSTILFVPPVWLTHVAVLLMAVSFVLVAATYLPGYIKWFVRHPMILGVKLWAFAHLLANGDAASVVLFGAFLIWGVADRISVKRREAAGLIEPRAFKPNALFDAAAVTVGIGVYVLFVWRLHLWLIGVPPVAV
ncbi:MAG: NnrU family protein [Pseudomonadota bacterium]